MGIKINKKNKIVSSVIFDGDLDYLQFRLKEFYEKFDYFLIIESNLTPSGEEKGFIYLKNNHLFDEWSEKIIYIQINMDKVDFTHDSLKLHQFESLINSCESLNLNFDDIILISNEDEFPDIDDPSVLSTHLSYGPITLSMQDFLWTTKFVKNERYIGTLGLSFSHLIVDKKTILPLFCEFEKKKFGIDEVFSGYKFRYFCSPEETIKKLSLSLGQINIDEMKDKISKSRNELLYVDFATDSIPKPLKKYYGELPSNVGLLNEQKIGRSFPKKYCVVIGFDATHNIKEDFEEVMVILPTDKIWTNDPISVDNKTTVYYVSVPNKQYYDILIDENNLDNFKKMYFFNEIKKILHHKNPLDIDEFHLYVGGKSIIKKWEEIEKEFIYDLIQ